MKPFSYRVCATRIACRDENRSLRLASCCSVDVVNGAAGRRVYGFSSTEETVYALWSSALARRRASAKRSAS